jgi:hypothetical protein
MRHPTHRAQSVIGRTAIRGRRALVRRVRVAPAGEAFCPWRLCMIWSVIRIRLVLGLIVNPGTCSNASAFSSPGVEDADSGSSRPRCRNPGRSAT